MSDLILQTIIFSLVLIIAMTGLVFFFKSNTSNQLSDLQVTNDELTDQNLRLAAEVNETKQALGVSQATIQHLKTIKDDFVNGQKTQQKQQEDISLLRTELSTLQAQYDEKVAQLETMSVDAVTTKAEIDSIKNLNLQLSRDNAELTEKVNQISDLKQEIASQKSEINEKNKQLAELMASKSADAESKKSKNAVYNNFQDMSKTKHR